MKIELRCKGTTLDADARATALQRIWACLDRHAHAVQDVHVLVTDENGPRGGVDTRCVARLRLRHGGGVVATALAEDPLRSIADAGTSAQRALVRRLRVAARRKPRARTRPTPSDA